MVAGPDDDNNKRDEWTSIAVRQSTLDKFRCVYAEDTAKSQDQLLGRMMDSYIQNVLVDKDIGDNQ